MSSDSEIDDLQRFEDTRQRKLARQAGLDQNGIDDDDISDEEVLGLNSGSESSEEDQYGYYDQDEATVKERQNRANRQADENWGNTRDNYFGGEDDIGAEEGASEEEEEEALRLQQKELDEMSESDFVANDDIDEWKKGADTLDSDAPKEAAPIDPSSMTADERKELIEEKFPAVLLLSKELSKLPEWEKELEAHQNKPEEVLKIGRIALKTYKGMIYSFFALFEDRLQKGDISGLSALEEHPVNEGLLLARQLWLNSQEIIATGDLRDSPVEDALSQSLAPIKNSASMSIDSDENESVDSGDLSANELNETDASEISIQSDENMENDSEMSEEFSIAKPQYLRKNIKKQPTVEDFDETADTIEQQARAKNKQSLRFYTSQIGKDDQRRQQSYSGDADLPYREREFERRQRLMAEAQRRGAQQKDHFDNDSEDFDNEEAGTSAAGGKGTDLYSVLKKQRDASREDREQRNAEARQAARAGRIAEYLAENPNVDKRAINYQIEKNKGLTPKRKKENRNARVKKRLRYEAAQKKLKSVRKVYKGAEGPYQGELTGIRKNLTHSTRFKN